MSALKPDVDGTHDLGTTALRWRALHVDTITTAEAADGGTQCTIGTDLVVTGNLTVNGDTTTLSTSTLNVEDIQITVANGAADSAAADGAGLLVDGASASLLYSHAGTQWELNKPLEITGNVLPQANVTHDLGSSSLGWNDLYLGDAGVIQLGNEQDVTLTHIPDTGIRLNDGMKLQFRDTTEYLHSDGVGSMTLEGASAVKLSVGNNTVLSVDANSVDIAQQLNVGAETASTSSSTGALVVDGGMGLAGDAHFGGDLSLQHDAAELHFGADDDVKLTHVADTGLLLNDGMALRFRDATLEVKSSLDGQLDVLADTEVAIVAPVVDIDATTAVRVSNDLELDSDAAVLKFGVDSDVSLTHVADTGLLLNSGMQLQFGDSGENIKGDGNDLILNSGRHVDLNATSALDVDAASVAIDATGAFSVQGADDSDVTVAAEAKDLSLVVSGGGAQVLSLASAGTGTDAIDITASAGGVDIDANGVLALDGAGGIDIGKTADVAIDIDSSTLNIDASGTISIDANGAAINIGADAAAGDISIGTNATSRNITVGSTTGETALNLNAGSTGIRMGIAGDTPVDIDATTFTLDTSSTLSLDSADDTNLTMTAADGENKVLTIAAVNNGAGEGQLSLSSDSQVTVTDGSATLLLDGGATSVSGASTLTLDASGALELNSSAGAISIGNDNVNQAINVGTSGVRTLTLGSANATKVDMNAGEIEADAGTQLVLKSAGVGAAAIDIDSDGGIDIDASGDIHLETSGVNSSITLVSSHSGAQAFHIDANANANSEVDIDAGVLKIDSTGDSTLTSGGTFVIDATSATSIDSDSLLTLGGASVDINADAGTLSLDGSSGIDIGTNAAVPVNFDASSLDIDSTDTTSLVMTANSAAQKVVTIDAINEGAGAAKIVVGSTASTNVDIGGASSTVAIGNHLTVAGDLTVTGTTTTVNTVTMTAANAVVFEGATPDDFESTLTIIDPTADRTIKLPNQSGCLPVLSADSATQITATPEELNYVDGVTSNIQTQLDAKAPLASPALTGTATAVNLTASGRIITSSTTDATTDSDGAISTAGGISIAKTAVVGDNIKLQSDFSEIIFGENGDVVLSHEHNQGLRLNTTRKLEFNDNAVYIHSDQDGHLHLDADTQIELAISMNNKLAVDNTTSTFGTNIVVPDSATIGSASDTDAITISDAGVITLSSTTVATSTSTGALVVGGGVGIADDLFVGGDLSVAGGTFVNATQVKGSDFQVQTVFGTPKVTLTSSGNITGEGSLTMKGSCNLGDSTNDTTSISGNAVIAGSLITQKLNSGGTTTLAAGQYIYLVTSDNQTITLPSASGLTGIRFVIKQTAAHSSGTTIATNDSGTIDGSDTITLGTRYAFAEVLCDGTNWHIIAQGGTVTLN